MAANLHDELAARLARMKHLIEELERVCSDSADRRHVLEKLRHEMDQAHRALKPHTS